MLNLYWKPANSASARSLSEVPFPSEASLEDYLVGKGELLGDIFILGRQIRTGSHQGVLDMIGVDQDSRVCLIELKNQMVTEDVLPQVLGYAIWAESNPDSIKAVWLQTDNKPEGLEIDWTNLDPRIIIVGPSYGSNIRKMAGKIGFDVELLQIQRFTHDQEEFLLVERLEQPQGPPSSVTAAMAKYDAAFYESSHGRETVRQFMAAVMAVEALAKEAGWNLETKYNKGYVSFKYGTRICFGVEFDSTYQWSVFAKVPEAVATTALPGWTYWGYEPRWKQSYHRAQDPAHANVQPLKDLLQVAYEDKAGKP